MSRISFGGNITSRASKIGQGDSARKRRGGKEEERRKGKRENNYIQNDSKKKKRKVEGFFFFFFFWQVENKEGFHKQSADTVCAIRSP